MTGRSFHSDTTVSKKPVAGRRRTSGECPPAIVVGLDSMQGLQAARILAARGIPVIAVASDPKDPACSTLACQDIIISETRGLELAQTLAALGAKLGQRAVLLPCLDASVLTVSRHRRMLSQWFHITLAPPMVVELLADKVLFYAYARKNRFPVPETHCLTTRREAKDAAESLSYPCALKPGYRSPRWESHTMVKVFKVSCRAELLDLYDRWIQVASPLIAQQWIEGPDSNLYSYNGYFNANHEPLVSFVSRKIRQWPIQTGHSSLGIEWREDTILNESLRLFRSVGYQGLGYLEMKQDSISGKFLITEPNVGRPTGRSAIAEAAGVELLYTMYCDVLGRPLPEQREQTYGDAKWIHLRRDTQAALTLWRRGELSLREWRDSLAGPKCFALYSPQDPWPFVHDLARAARHTLTRSERQRRGIGSPFAGEVETGLDGVSSTSALETTAATQKDLVIAKVP